MQRREKDKEVTEWRVRMKGVKKPKNPNPQIELNENMAMKRGFEAGKAVGPKVGREEGGKEVE